MLICWLGTGTSVAARCWWTKVALYHSLVTGGLVRAHRRCEDGDPAPNSVTLVKTGLGIQVAGVFVSVARPRVEDRIPSGPCSLLSVVVAIVFLGIRLNYALVSMTSRSSTAASLNLSIQVLLTMAAGAYTRNVRCLSKAEAARSHGMKGAGGAP
ncbi:hypothetical protein QQZ08_008898 [Neonectria magnoliae]|uniref:Uncharacterized protein n=1 Tax=Neonectria magnoliae TaxID=2732573 RepID=A0ABR1HSA4_9HYPO